MASISPRLLLLLLWAAIAIAYDDVEEAGSDSLFFKALRDMTNQTKVDTLNLPANASSIRENITDTFSCENRTYGYYADVDNDCQVFHVCLPSQTPAGRNVTYRWSFICPNETIFNQEVLTCARPRDSIDCKDSEMFYHVNMDIGKVPEKTEDDEPKKEDKKEPPKINRRKDLRKQNLVLDNVYNDAINEELREKLEEYKLRSDNSPLLFDAVIEETPEDDREELDRIVMERNMRNAREMKRGSFRFQGDV